MNRAVQRVLATSAAYLALGETCAGGVPEAMRLVDRYTAFAGSLFNAVNLVIGLRTGRAIFLWQGDAGVRFGSPTGPLGWGSVQRAIDLARVALAGHGIVRPTPAEIERALIGTTALPGVLRLRGEGVDWARIAYRVVHPVALPQRAAPRHAGDGRQRLTPWRRPATAGVRSAR